MGFHWYMYNLTGSSVQGNICSDYTYDFFALQLSIKKELNVIQLECYIKHINTPIQIQSVQVSWISKSDVMYAYVEIGLFSHWTKQLCQVSELFTGIFLSVQDLANSRPVVCSKDVPEVTNGRNKELVVLSSVHLSTFPWLKSPVFHSHWQICICSQDATSGN